MITFNHNFSKSVIFKALNIARRVIREKGVEIDKGRLNRAFGLVQAKTMRPYVCTPSKCNCIDARKGYICKHRLAVTLLHYAQMIEDGKI